MEIKTIQEVLKEYSVELKSENSKVSIYACKNLLHTSKLSAHSARSTVFRKATRSSDLLK